LKVIVSPTVTLPNLLR